MDPGFSESIVWYVNIPGSTEKFHAYEDVTGTALPRASATLATSILYEAPVTRPFGRYITTPARLFSSRYSSILT